MSWTLVTGATGFIGSHIVKYLAGQGKKVICLVRPNSKTDYLHSLGVKVFIGDLLNKASLKEALKDVNFVYHLAAAVGKHPEDVYWKINLEATRNLVDICRDKTNFSKFIFFSSGSVIGEAKNRLFVDENTECVPVTTYGKSKYQAELILLEYHRKFGMPIVILRLPIVYGPGDINSFRDLSVLKLCQYIKKGKFFICGCGDGAKRSLLHIENLVYAAMLAEGSDNATGKIYFVANEEPVALRKLAVTIAGELNKKLRIINIPASIALAGASFSELHARALCKFPGFSRRVVKGMTSNWICDISKLKGELGYSEPVSFKEGIKKTTQWYIENNIL